MVLNSLRIKKAYGCAGIIKRLTIEITNDCQFKCPYCIKGIPNVRRISHIKPEYIDKFFDICRKYDIYNENDLRIYITGGEPTISPYFLDIIELCACSLIAKMFFKVRYLCNICLVYASNALCTK